MKEKLISFTGGSGITGLLMFVETISVTAAIEVFIFGFLGGIAGLFGKEVYNLLKYKVFKVKRTNSK